MKSQFWNYLHCCMPWSHLTSVLKVVKLLQTRASSSPNDANVTFFYCNKKIVSIKTEFGAFEFSLLYNLGTISSSKVTEESWLFLHAGDLPSCAILLTENKVLTLAMINHIIWDILSGRQSKILLCIMAVVQFRCMKNL